MPRAYVLALLRGACVSPTLRELTRLWLHINAYFGRLPHIRASRCTTSLTYHQLFVGGSNGSELQKTSTLKARFAGPTSLRNYAEKH